MLHHASGRKGIGLGKRAASPTDLERLAKAAKVDEETSKESFRDRTRREFEQKRAENRLVPAQNTCVTLDEKAGKQVRSLHVLFYVGPHRDGEMTLRLFSSMSSG